MIIESKNLYASRVENNDMLNILEVYNSNNKFLEAHMGKKSVDIKWLEKENETMKEAGFNSYKIIKKNDKKTIGLIDFALKEECYLSLLMIHDKYKNKGYGKEIYLGFEDYIRFNECKTIRIDVVTNYDSSVLEFWEFNGFKVIENIMLNWTGKMLPAVVMKKNL